MGMHQSPQNKYRLLFEKANEAIIILKEDKINEINESARKLFKCPEESLIGKPLNFLIPISKEALEEALKSEAKTLEIECKRFNGTPIELEISLSKARLGKEEFIFAFIRDITKKKKEVKRLIFLSIKDPLTGIYNRRYFEKRLKEEIKRANRTGRTFSLIMFDLDDFKKINDIHGHEIGDITLRKVSRIISERIRETDIFCRWGGEEFLILLPDTDLNGAVKLAEELKERINQIEIPGGKKLTASFGVTSYEPGDTLKTLRTRADTLLYKSKSSGKNRISFK